MGIEFYFETGIHRILGIDSAVTGVDIVNFVNRENRRIPADYLILESGRYPELIFVKTPEAASGVHQDTVPIAPAPSQAGALEWEAMMPYKRPEHREDQGLLSPATSFPISVPPSKPSGPVAGQRHRSIS